MSQGTVIGGGSAFRAASIAARKVSDVRSSAAPRSPQRRTKYPYTVGSASSYSANSARGASPGSGSALTPLSSRRTAELRRPNREILRRVSAQRGKTRAHRVERVVKCLPERHRLVGQPLFVGRQRDPEHRPCDGLRHEVAGFEA